MIFSHRRVLPAWMTVSDFQNFLESLDPSESHRVGELEKLQAAAKKRLALLSRVEAGIADNPQEEAIGHDFERQAEEIMREPLYKNSFGESAEIMEVEIGKLVTNQCDILLDYAQHLEGRISRNISKEELFEFCLSMKKEAEPITISQEGTGALTYQYSSDNPELRILRIANEPAGEIVIRERFEGMPLRAIVILIGYGLPAISLVRDGNRLVVNNGTHRLFLLYSLGFRKAFAVVRKHLDQKQTGISEFTYEKLKNDPRPPMIRDFFDPLLTADAWTRKRHYSIKVSMEAEKTIEEEK